MKRITDTNIPAPTDNAPIPPPKLTFGTQKPKPDFPTGGLFSFGSIKFNLNNIAMVELAKQTFAENSIHRDAKGALEMFLRSLSITSAFEAGFDGVNTYDKAGISVGFIQLARPEGGVDKLLELIGKPDLAAKVKTAFGTKDPHNSAAALKARFNQALVKEVVTAAASPAGIKAQFAMAINKNVSGQNYFDKAYSRFLECKLSDDLCCAMLFDAAVNMGAGSVSKFSIFTHPSEGEWIAAGNNNFSRRERKEG